MAFVEYFIIFVIAVVIVMFVVQNIDHEVEYVRSKVDKKLYLVRSLPDKQRAADILANINKEMIKLIKHMQTQFPNSDHAKLLYKNYDPTAISEGSPDSGYTSYSVNKGEKLVICIRNTDNSFVDFNVILYPTIHELGHLMTPEIGHTPLFWQNFKILLQEAINIGIYTRVDFKNSPTPYCGITITSSVV
jgi:hypothetical protein